jgi:xanthine dehydrogenase YagT iron-sulfur-binding subunit
MDGKENDARGHHPAGKGSVSRRSFLRASTTTAATLSFIRQAFTSRDAAAAPALASPRDPVSMTLRVNGVDHSMDLDVRVTLLDCLREHLGLTGSKKGCDQGQCGACTVHVNGERVLSCLTLAAAVQGQEVTTIEGLARDGKLHPMQQAFIDNDGFQCGYCTPGQIMSAVACVKEGHASNADQIREYMSGNLCRCAAYPNIVAAIEQARQRMEA